MLVKNVSKRRYIHALGDEYIMLNADESKEIPDEVAKIWIKMGEIVKVDDGSKDKEIERLKAENEKLKAQSKCDEGNAKKDELLAKCKEYGIRYGNPKTVSVATLQKKIAEYEQSLADQIAE
ncbi:MAG: hypothetical protein UE295_12065 [Acutalibacteraceae bacterium]|nr:hypothetical protein [Acutalibacteraceae bacterium]